MIITQGKSYKKYLLIVIILVAVAGGVILELSNRTEKVSPSSKYDMIYCSGHSDTVNEIKILNGQVIKPARDGHLSLEAYDYQCYLLDTDSLAKEELTIQGLNSLDLIIFESSPSGLRIIRELESPEAFDFDGGLIFYKVFLANGSTKRLVYSEEDPVMIFRLIGWAIK